METLTLYEKSLIYTTFSWFPFKQAIKQIKRELPKDKVKFAIEFFKEKRKEI